MWFTVSTIRRRAHRQLVYYVGPRGNNTTCICSVLYGLCTRMPKHLSYIYVMKTVSVETKTKKKNNNIMYNNGHTIREKSFGNRPCSRCDWPAATTRARVTGPDVSTRLRHIFTYFLWNDLVSYFEFVVIEYRL